MSPTNEEVLEAMGNERTAVTTMRAAMRDADMQCEKSKKMNRLVRDMIELAARFEWETELIARFEWETEDGVKNG